eukprot:3276435-Amphidinium_carterae.1
MSGLSLALRAQSNRDTIHDGMLTDVMAHRRSQVANEWLTVRGTTVNRIALSLPHKVPSPMTSFIMRVSRTPKPPKSYTGLRCLTRIHPCAEPTMLSETLDEDH